MSYKNYHPIYVDLNGRAVLIVGGGAVAMEKLDSLMPSGAAITVVSPEATEAIKGWVAEGKLTWHPREFVEQDADEAFMVIAATDDPALNARVFRAGETRLRLANSVDDPDNCNFIMAAITKQGPMQVAVSSAGCSPALAQRLRNRIASELLSPQLGALAAYVGSWRGRVKSALPIYRHRQGFWDCLLDSELPAVLERDGVEAADALMAARLEIAANAKQCAARLRQGSNGPCHCAVTA